MSLLRCPAVNSAKPPVHKIPQDTPDAAFEKPVSFETLRKARTVAVVRRDERAAPCRVTKRLVTEAAQPAHVRVVVIAVDGSGDEAVSATAIGVGRTGRPSCINLLKFGSGPSTLSTDISTVVIMNTTPGI